MSAVGSGAVGIAFYTLSLMRLARLMRDRRNLRLDYDGRVAVVRALSALSPEGYRVYHDVPAEGFTIDHVLVGKKGVFALETITRPKPARAGGVERATLAYNGHVLFFPRATDDHTVARAEKQAEWLSEWLGRATGEKVAVRAVVAAPGWFIKRTTPAGIPVVNPKQIASLFEHITAEAAQRRPDRGHCARTRTGHPLSGPTPAGFESTALGAGCLRPGAGRSCASSRRRRSRTGPDGRP